MVNMHALYRVRSEYDRVKAEAKDHDERGCYPREVLLVSRLAGMASVLAQIGLVADRDNWESACFLWQGRGAMLVGVPCTRGCIFCRPTSITLADFPPASVTAGDGR